jgi:hypothetical protein
MTAKIRTRALLMDALRLAAELEHGLMCQYLFAAYTIRRYPYECFDYTWNRRKKTWEKTRVLSEAELERVRRWAMKVTLIARQEMEHLGLALNLLSSIGGTPSFSRPNMPQKDDYYGAADIKLTLTTCNLDTIKRFQIFEKPEEIDDVEDQKQIDDWCRRARTAGPPPPPEPEETTPLLMGGAPHIDQYGVPFADVQQLYTEIEQGFIYLTRSLGECELFIGSQGNQVYGGPPSPLNGSMNDLNQYGLSLIPVTDLKSARQAIRMIIEQGEGAKAPPSYRPNAHFCLFSEIRSEMEEDKQKLAKVGARNVVANPLTRWQPDITAPRREFTLIENPDTLRVAELFNQCYEVMLLLLLYLYSDQVKTEEQTNSLMDAAFFPFMTMFVRPLAEILTELPANDPYDLSKMAGPGFELAGDVVLFPNIQQTWTLFQERIDALVAGFRGVTARGPIAPPKNDPHLVRWAPRHDPWRDLPSQSEEYVVKQRQELWERVKAERVTFHPEEGRGREREEFLPSLAWLRLYYLRQNMERLALNWKDNWMNVGRTA